MPNVYLSWNYNGADDHYELRDGAVSWAAATVLGETRGNFYIVLNPSAGSHTYRIKPVNAAGAYGAEQTITLTVAPYEYDIGFVWGGLPGTLDQVSFVATQAVTLPSGLTGSKGICGTACTGSTTIDIEVNGVSKGSAVFAASGTTATFTFSSSGSIAVGDIITLKMPTIPDATGKDFSITLKATR